MTKAKGDPSVPNLVDSIQPDQAENEPSLAEVKVPSAPFWLGLFGAIPFVFLALGRLFLDAPAQRYAEMALITYGAIILSFLGGIHWGLVIANPIPNLAYRNKVPLMRLCASVVPSLLGWCALLIPRQMAVPALSLIFLWVLFFDLQMSKQGQAPSWYPKLRWPLTTIVLISYIFEMLT